MSKPPSAETQLRTARSDLRRLSKLLAEANEERSSYRIRATKAGQECADWRRRFDELVRRIKDKL